MNERMADIPAPQGTMDAFITHPEQGGPFPAVVIYMDLWGLREELFDIARRVATAGYYCVVPNLFYRQGKIRHEFRDEKGRMISLDRLDQEKQERVRAPWRALNNGLVVEDTRHIMDFIDADPAARRGPMGAIGYCMGGRYVCCVAGHYPERFRAGASMHGTALVTDKPDSPHLRAAAIRGELYCGFAENDRGAPPAMVDAFATAMKASSAKYSYRVHEGAAHGYALPDRDIADKQAMNRDWEVILPMLQRTLA